jgi:hypothetical protein
MEELYQLIHNKVMSGELKLKFKPADSGYVASVEVPIDKYRFGFAIGEKDFICTYGFGSICSPNQIFSGLFTKEEIEELRERSKNPIYKLKEQEIKLLEKKLKELKGK